MPVARRSFLVSLGAALLAACTAPEEVPPERIPSFDPSLVGRPNLALVLGGGGPRGFAHVGVIKVLEEAGIVPDLVVGASVGAMVGALYAAGMGAAELEREANDLDVVSFFELSMVGGGLARPPERSRASAAELGAAGFGSICERARRSGAAARRTATWRPNR